MSGTEVSIRAERSGDEASICRVNDAAFGGPREGGIVDAIRGTDRWVEGGSLVAEDGDPRVVGHLLLSEGDLVAVDGTVRRIWMIGPVAVLPTLQRQGIGSALMNAAIALATDRNRPILCLVGHADYYPRFGFEPARALGLEPPDPWPSENWLALRLPAWDASVRGLVHFPPAFATGQPEH